MQTQDLAVTVVKDHMEGIPSKYFQLDLSPLELDSLQLRAAAQAARRRQGEEEELPPDYYLAHYLSDLFWAVHSGDAKLALETLWRIVDDLDLKFLEEWERREEVRDLWALAALLMPLERERVAGSKRGIQFYAEARDAAEKSVYACLLEPLADLRGCRLGDPKITAVKQKIYGVHELETFELLLIILLLENLE